MRPLFLDYQRRRNAISGAGIALLLAGLAAAGYGGMRYYDLSSEISLLEEKRLTLEHRMHGASQKRPFSQNPQQLAAEIKLANEVVAQLTLPWDALFKDVEMAPSDRVALLAIQPDAQKHLIKITGEAKDFDAMLEYIKFLQARGSFAGVYLQSHHIQQQVAEKPVRFALIATWVIKL